MLELTAIEIGRQTTENREWERNALRMEIRAQKFEIRYLKSKLAKRKQAILMSKIKALLTPEQLQELDEDIEDGDNDDESDSDNEGENNESKMEYEE